MIYCVEDEAGIRNMMIYALEAANFKVKGIENAEALEEALAHQQPSLILLDIMLPDQDGIAILQSLKNRASTQDIPVVMATAKGMEYDKVIGLDLGADDYLVKPFSMLEMVSRVRAVLRRCEKNQPAELIIGKISLNPVYRTVYVEGEKIKLTYKEFEMLYLFMKHPGRVFSRDEFLELVWNQDCVGETRTVDVHIRTLRQKLGVGGDYIETIRGVGYKMEYE